ncbi:uncharacterized protein LOC142518882 [Primulina tabacum]|uniref:uncharacterized protein LOC142518882 n=1 Tax=Primulina tabacum TaxID=48773 RepID=UPI003F59A654
MLETSRLPKVTLNEVSSVETDNMDMNFSEETNPLLGGRSSSSDKAFHMEANFDSSSFKTPGLEVKIPMKCAYQAKQKSNLCMDISPNAEPVYRWVKRLKLSSSHSSARGTESINLAENSNRKRNNFFSRVLKSDVTRSESTLKDRSW